MSQKSSSRRSIDPVDMTSAPPGYRDAVDVCTIWAKEKYAAKYKHVSVDSTKDLKVIIEGNINYREADKEEGSSDRQQTEGTQLSGDLSVKVGSSAVGSLSASGGGQRSQSDTRKETSGTAESSGEQATLTVAPHSAVIVEIITREKFITMPYSITVSIKGKISFLLEKEDGTTKVKSVDVVKLYQEFGNGRGEVVKDRLKRKRVLITLEGSSKDTTNTSEEFSIRKEQGSAKEPTGTSQDKWTHQEADKPMQVDPEPLPEGAESMISSVEGKMRVLHIGDPEEEGAQSMISSLTEHGRHPYRYRIASVNFMRDTEAMNAASRKELLSELLNRVSASIVFVQRCPWDAPRKHLQLQEKFRYTGVCDEAGILWDSEVFHVKRLDSYELIGDKYPSLIPHRRQACICEVTLKELHTAGGNIALEKSPNVSEFIAISWRGPYNCPGEEKQQIFRDLLSLSKSLTEDGSQKACIIGGGFNLSIDKAQENIDNSFSGLTIASSGSDPNDYFIFTSDMINVLQAKQFSLDYDATQEKDIASSEVSDIPPGKVIHQKSVLAVLDLGSPHPFSSSTRGRLGTM
ncbi:Hypp8711 [Branchiostoma lanceolatum]|uniref:Hypp8711 protein n=1 Tax=Branchiostoma lanceolatum TaxID=7740 RepID=A0A8K0EEE5_BRALA|nr:Hypp8711 [Branchiostoma lanceolatum]